MSLDGDPEPVEHDYQIRVNKFGRIGNLAFLCSIFVVVAALLWRSAYDIPAGGSAGVGTPLTPVDLIYDTGTAVEPALLDPVLKDFIGTFGREKLRPKRVKISSGTVYSESSLVSQIRTIWEGDPFLSHVVVGAVASEKGIVVCVLDFRTDEPVLIKMLDSDPAMMTC